MGRSRRWSSVRAEFIFRELPQLGELCLGAVKEDIVVGPRNACQGVFTEGNAPLSLSCL